MKAGLVPMLWSPFSFERGEKGIETITWAQPGCAALCLCPARWVVTVQTAKVCKQQASQIDQSFDVLFAGLRGSSLTTKPGDPRQRVVWHDNRRLYLRRAIEVYFAGCGAHMCFAGTLTMMTLHA